MQEANHTLSLAPKYFAIKTQPAGYLSHGKEPCLVYEQAKINIIRILKLFHYVQVDCLLTMCPSFYSYIVLYFMFFVFYCRRRHVHHSKK